MASPFTKPAILADTTITGGVTWDSATIPKGTRQFEFQNRSNQDVKYSFVSNGATFKTLKASCVKFEDRLHLQVDLIIYFNGTAGDVVEVEYWT